MPTEGQELASLDFDALIGGPLTAVIRAQAQSALTTVDFIKAVGFQADPANTNAIQPINVSFNYVKQVPDAATGNLTPQTMSLNVPVLAMMPIPYIRVESTEIEFNAKINSTQYTNTSTSLDFNASLEAKAKWAVASVKFKASVAYQKKTNTGSEVERTYNMRVKVRAVQDELPAGTERLLGILENAITETPASSSN